ncbi:MAG: hypothetical protein ACI4KA_02820 [Oscillospiraceae bacterium]
MSEIRRVLLSRKTILFMLIAALLGAVFFLYDCGSEKEITLSGEQLSAYIESYPEQLHSIRENAENYSKLAALSGGFSAENIRKTAADYGRLAEVKPVIGNNKGFVLLSGYVTGDVLILAATLLISQGLCEERKKGLDLLIRSTKNGRRGLSAQRVTVIVTAALAASILLHFFCYAAAVLACGDMGISRPIQSVPEFSLCPYPITISDYLVFSVLLKALAAAVSGLLLYFLSALFEPIITFGLFGGAAVVQLILYGAILPTDRLAPLKFCNIAAVLRTDIFFGEYCNLNIFGNAVGFLPCALFAVGGVFAVLAAACCMFTPNSAEGLSLGGRAFMSITSLISRKAPPAPLPLWEAKKVFINQKGAIILAVVIYIAVSSALQYRYVIPAYSKYEEMYYGQFGGTITEEMRSEMTAEHDRVSAEQKALYEEYMAELEANDFHLTDNLIPKYNRLVDMQEQLITLDEFIERADRALAYTDCTGIKTELIKPKTYELLLVRDTATTSKNALYILLALVGVFAGICANESRCNMNAVLKSTARGRGRLTAIKLGLIGVTSILVTAAVFTAQVLLIGTQGYNDIMAAAQSLEFLRFVPFEISILGYLVLMFLVRMTAAFAVGAAVMLISRCCGSRITAVCIGAVVFVVPAALSGTGIISVPSAADFVGFSVMG